MLFESVKFECDAIQWTGSNWGEIKAWANAEDGIVGPVEEHSMLMVRTIADAGVGVPLTYWVVREPKDPARFYPVEPSTFALRWRAKHGA